MRGAAAPTVGGGVCLAAEAMATRFELVLHGADPTRLRSAGEAALAEVRRLDRQLSAFSPTSDISWINARAGGGPVQIEPELFALLRRCRELSGLTGGAFDVTVGPLMRAWRLARERNTIPDGTARVAAHAAVGSSNLHLDETAGIVAFAKPGMKLDLGAAGKGYAIDRAMHLLRDHGIEHALLHGGTSSVHAIGTSPDGSPWRVDWAPPAGDRRTFALTDRAMSVSAIHGRSVVVQGDEYGHVLDPRTGAPTIAARAVAMTGPRSFECDALSTALLVLGPAWLPALRQQFPAYEGHVEPG